MIEIKFILVLPYSYTIGVQYTITIGIVTFILVLPYSYTIGVSHSVCSK